jgi:hypothetical protein
MDVMSRSLYFMALSLTDLRLFVSSLGLPKLAAFSDLTGIELAFNIPAYNS